MPYASPSDVRLIVETTLSDEELSRIIEVCDAEIERRLGSVDASNPLVRRLSILLAARMIRLRDPKARAVGEFREEAGDVLKILEEEIERLFRLLSRAKVRGTKYGVIRGRG